MTPEEDESTHNLKWNCTSTVDAKYLPNSCIHEDGGPTGPGNGEEGPTTPTQPAWDFTSTGSYLNGIATYDGNGKLNYGGTILNGVMNNGEMIFNIPNSQSSPIKTVTIDKNGNMIQNYDMGGYKAGALYLNGGGNENIGTYSYNIDGNTINAINPSYQTIPDSLKTNGENDPQKYQVWQNLTTAIGTLSNIASNQPHAGTNAEAIANYQNAVQAYSDLLNQYKSTGGQLRENEQYFLDNVNR